MKVTLTPRSHIRSVTLLQHLPCDSLIKPAMAANGISNLINLNRTRLHVFHTIIYNIEIFVFEISHILKTQLLFSLSRVQLAIAKVTVYVDIKKCFFFFFTNDAKDLSLISSSPYLTFTKKTDKYEIPKTLCFTSIH